MNTKSETKSMRLVLPVQLVESIGRAKKETDLDRTKFVRAAIRKELDRLGIAHDLSHADAAGKHATA